MLKTGNVEKYPYYFILFYAVTYMANAVYNTFFPVYLNSIGYSKAAVGILLALGPLVAVAAQPLWGIAGDRAASKNNVLKILVIGSSAAILLYPLNNSFYYLISVIILFTFFQSSITPISDAIALEHLETSRWKFSRIRLAGTLGFAFMSVAAGVIAHKNIKSIFLLYFIIAVMSLLTIYRLPGVKGHQSEGIKVPIWNLFKVRGFAILIAFNFMIQLTFGFYYNFFPIYYRQLGAGSSLLGWAMFITSTSEIPFLLFADKILEKLGLKLVLTAAALIIAVRWLLLYFVTDIHAILLVNASHGLTFIVFSFCLATFINKSVFKELRASGQTMNALLCMGLARITGSVLGGIMSDIVGIRVVFLYTSLIDFAAVIIFGTVFMFQIKREKIGKRPSVSGNVPD